MGNTWTLLSVNLSDAYHRFLETASKLDVSQRTKSGVCGEWSPKDIVAHLVGWDAEALRGFTLFADDQADSFVPIDVHKIDEFNAKSVAARQDLSWDDVIGEMKSTFQALQDKIEIVRKKELNADGGFGQWLIGRKDDYEYHSAQLQSWLPTD